MRTLLLDNYDSFTFNLFQLISEVSGTPPIVVRNDEATWDELAELDFDNIVISPGPGRPEVQRDFGVCADAILNADVPILGVCLGHQGICHLLGGRVDYAAKVMHGRPSDIHHDGTGVLEGIPSPFVAIRYHSLHATRLPVELEATAWTDDGILMAVRHRTLPIFGVQFHPESICTEYGQRILSNFRNITERRKAELAIDSEPLVQRYRPAEASPSEVVIDLTAADRPMIHGRPLQVLTRRVPRPIDADRVFVNLYGESRPAFWLDSALVRGFSRFSYMGDASGPHAEFVNYNVNERQVTVTHGEQIESFDESIFDYLARMLAERRVVTEGLPFDFNAGYAGYLGYELKADCGATNAYRSPTPDAGFVFADRLIAFDHEEEVAYLVCVDDIDHTDRAMRWIEETYNRIIDLPPVPQWSRTLHPVPVEQEFRHPAERYLELIAECKREIKHGESYEICLTNMITQKVMIDPLNTYRALRERNPAPYATYLNFPDVAVLSSSPERFLTVDASGQVESKPIKGTRKRGATPEEDEDLYQDLRTNEKDRSENLMIVDLLRNDIGELAEIGSVHVSRIFAVESYATVHQLVSTVRGRLRRGVSSVEAVRRAFPGGSMTGAPKKRTMEIIDRLEAGPRGVYSGSIGFFGLSGATDLSIVIRTIVMTAHDVTVGVGGAIVDLSDPEEELAEMLLKAKALISTLAETNLASLPVATGVR